MVDFEFKVLNLGIFIYGFLVDKTGVLVLNKGCWDFSFLNVSIRLYFC